MHEEDNQDCWAKLEESAANDERLAFQLERLILTLYVIAPAIAFFFGWGMFFLAAMWSFVGIASRVYENTADALRTKQSAMGIWRAVSRWNTGKEE